MSEFEIIDKYFAPLTMGHKSAYDLKDDAAVLKIPDKHELVVTSDTLNESVHFLKDETPENIARKALRVNLSDLAAMAATPLCYQLNIAFPKKPLNKWLEGFSNTLYKDNKEYNIFCSGGDTTSTHEGGLSISITAMGIVPKGQAVRRAGAKNGDYIVITGCVGGAALGLKLLQKGLCKEWCKESVERYFAPVPRVNCKKIIRKYANAAMDISDGLIADYSHMAKASRLGAEIDIAKIKFSQEVNRAIDDGIFSIEEAITGGDDYELILAVSKGNIKPLLDELNKINLNPMVIGCFLDSDLGLKFVNTKGINISEKGWEHF